MVRLKSNRLEYIDYKMLKHEKIHYETLVLKT